MIPGGHLGGNTGLREMGTQGWQGFVSFGFVNNMQVRVSFQIFVNVKGLDEILQLNVLTTQKKFKHLSFISCPKLRL